jgi:phosphohistidine phosphatase
MKTLYLLRHAKSSWAVIDQKDFDRPLNDRGLRDAPEMAQGLRDEGVRIDLVVSSPALRTITTAQVFCTVLGIEAESILQDRQIYLAGSAKLMQLISCFDEMADSALLVAHNPALTDLANDLANAGIDNIPTCGLVTLALPVAHWAEIQPGEAKMLAFDFPKNPD